MLVLWWCDRVDTKECRNETVCKKPYTKGPEMIGIFATRSPVRPNPIALSAVPVLGIDAAAGVIRVAYIDADDCTPVLDIKPYLPCTERIRDAAGESPYLHEISGEVQDVRGIRFLGVPTGRERRMGGSAEGPVDIVVAHAPLANRVWLFDLPAACVITGHYGMMVGKVAGKAYLSLDCSPASWAVIAWDEGWRRIEYAAGTCRIEMRPEEGVAATGCDPAELRRLTGGRGSLPYPDEVEALRRAKLEIATLGREEAFRRLLAMGIRKTHIERYLGGRVPVRPR